MTEPFNDDPLAQHVGKSVRWWRLRQKLSPPALARKAGLTVPTIHRIESGGGCHIASVSAVARALGVEPGVFFPGRAPHARIHARGALYDEILSVVERLTDDDRAAILPFLRALAVARPRPPTPKETP